MNNGLLFLGGLLVAVLAALFAVPNFIDWNSYRGVFEEEASKVLGRDVRVGGSVNLKLLPVPYVRFEKIRIASVTGQTGEPFVKADSFTMWLSGPALLRGVLEASQIELEKPVLTLAIDENGIGNWTKLEFKGGDLPFVPHDVALRSVQITDGAIALYNAASERIASVDGILGEFSADGAKGPFRFKGGASWSGGEHEVKFATDVPADDGSFALKLSAKADRSPNTFLLDGRVHDLSEKTTFKGRWTGKIQVPGSDTVLEPGKGAPPLLDLKSDVTADALGAKIQNLALSPDSAAVAQTVSGSAVATWTASPRLDLTLNSKWLDVDWLSGAGKGSASFEKLKQLALGLMQSVAGDTTASAKINLEQVKIGGENAGGLSVDADRQGNVTHLKTFKVSLPGGSRLDLSGDLKTKDGKFSFAGNGFVGGTSFARLKAWADKSGMPIDINADGPYSAAGTLEIDEKRFYLTDASGDISGRALAGELKITHDDTERTDLTLQAADLDTRDVFPKIATALGAQFRKSLGLRAQASEGEPDAKLPGDVRLRVIAGRLTNGDDTYRDVDVSFAIEGKKVSLPVVKATTASGLAIGLEGRIEIRDSGPFGTVSYDLVGATPEAMRDLVNKVGLVGVIGEDRFEGVKSGKIAGLVRLGARAAKTADVTFDGLLNGAKLNGRAEFDGGLSEWRSQPSRVQSTLEAPSLSALLAILGRTARETPQSVQPALASLVTGGTLATGSRAEIEISSQDFDMRYRGRAQWPENSDLALDGSVDVKANQAADMTAIAGLSLPAGADGIAARGTLNVRRDKAVWTVASDDFSLGTSKVTGSVTATTGPAATKIDGNIVADRVRIPGLLAAITDAPTAPAAAGVASADNGTVGDSSPIWPEGLFNFAALGNASASLKVAFKSLELSGNLATGPGTMTVALAPGKLAVGAIDAAAMGGRLGGNVSLEKASNGVGLALALKLDQAKLAAVNSGGKGTATLDLIGEARAQSPAGLVAVITGSGTAKLIDAEISGPSPASMRKVVDDVVLGKVRDDAQAIAAGLVSALGSSRLTLGDRDLAISLSDGSLKLGKIDIKSADGEVEGTTTADLTTLGMNAAFQLTSVVRPLSSSVVTVPNKAAVQRGPLPPAIVLYSGQLDNLGALAVSADAGDLQRELVVRQMERNVEELEQARRADEERARVEKEKERQSQLEAERAAAQEKQPEQLPPVIPESAGTANPANGGSGTNPDDFFGTSQPPADAQTSNRAGPEPQPQNSIQPADGAAGGQQSQVAAPVVIDPATGLPVPKPAPAVRPSSAKTTSQRQSQQRRTSSDEVLKSLGAFP